MSRQRKQRLGKGLSALLGEYADEAPDSIADGSVEQLPVDSLRPNPFQPRRELDGEKLGELVASIQDNGLLQPLVVRPDGADGWEIVAGERRWRAVGELGWDRVPAFVREVDDQTMLVLALIENLQREELTAIDEAHAYQRLIEEFGLTQGEVAEQVGRDRSTVSNSIRLLGLPAEVLVLVQKGELSAGHARALLAIEDRDRAVELAGRAIQEGLSVRALERQVRDLSSDGKPKKKRRGGGSGSAGASEPFARRAEQALGRALGTSVRVKVVDKRRGQIEIPFRDPEDFERIVEAIVGVGGIV